MAKQVLLDYPDKTQVVVQHLRNNNPVSDLDSLVAKNCEGPLGRTPVVGRPVLLHLLQIPEERRSCLDCKMGDLCSPLVGRMDEMDMVAVVSVHALTEMLALLQPDLVDRDARIRNFDCKDPDGMDCIPWRVLDQTGQVVVVFADMVVPSMAGSFHSHCPLVEEVACNRMVVACKVDEACILQVGPFDNYTQAAVHLSLPPYLQSHR